MLSQAPGHPTFPNRHRFLVGGVAIGLATVPVTVGFAASADASAAVTHAAAHGPSADALRGVGQPADGPDFPEKQVEIDLNPIGYYPPSITSGTTTVPGANVNGANFTATETEEDLTSVAPRAKSADDTNVTPNCTMDPADPIADFQDTAPGAEGCVIADLDTFGTYVVHEQVTPTGFDTDADKRIDPTTPPVDGVKTSKGSVRARVQPSGQIQYSRLTFANAGQWRAVILTKTDTGGAPLPGATYRLCADDPNNNPTTLAVGGCQRGQGDLGLQTTGANGQAEWPYALPGTYTLIETAAPAGYSLNPAQPLTVPVDPKGNANRSPTDADPVYVTAADTLVPVVVASPTVTPTASSTPTPVVSATPSVTPKTAVVTKKAPAKVKAVKHTRHVVHPKQPTGQLAFTGVRDETQLLLLGLGLIAAGTGAVALSRRRSS